MENRIKEISNILDISIKERYDISDERNKIKNKLPTAYAKDNKEFLLKEDLKLLDRNNTIIKRDKKLFEKSRKLRVKIYRLKNINYEGE